MSVNNIGTYNILKMIFHFFSLANWDPVSLYGPFIKYLLCSECLLNAIILIADMILVKICEDLPG